MLYHEFISDYQMNNVITGIWIVILAHLIFLVYPKISNADQENYPIGINLAGISDWSTEYPFLNLARQARQWIPQMSGKKWGDGGTLDLDENGWIRSLKPGQSADWIFITRNAPLPDNKFIVTYDGEGLISYKGIVHKIRSLGKNRDLISIANNAKGKFAILSIKKTNPKNYIRNIKIILKRYITSYDDGELFNPEWKSYIKHFNTIRFMNWFKINGSKVRTWNDRAKIEDYTWSVKGAPIEVIVKLANEVNRNIWLNIPHMADENYVKRLAKYVSTHLAKNRKIYLEHSNEVWNWGFPQTHYAAREAERMWGKHGNGYVQWHAKRTVDICKWWRSITKGDGHNVICVLAVQGGWQDLARITAECPLWKDGPCYKQGVNAIAITGYFTGCLAGPSGWKKPDKTEVIRSWFKDSDGGLKKGYLQALDGRFFSCPRTVKSMFRTYQEYKHIAENYGLDLLAYEGGQHITAMGLKNQNDKNFIKFHIALNRSDYMRKLTLKNFENWKRAGGGLFMYFVDISYPSKYGSWGSMDYLGDIRSPKYKAIVDFGQKHTIWWK